MKKIKLLALCLTILCLLTVFVGCGGSDDASSKASSSVSDTGSAVSNSGSAGSASSSTNSSDDAVSIEYDPTASMESISSTASIDEIVEVMD